MIDVKKLCEDSHRISKDKGWLEEKRSFAAVTALIHSELSEAIEDYRGNKGLNEVWYEYGKGVTLCTYSAEQAKEVDGPLKPCGIPSELADVIIRIAQHCGTEERGNELASHVEYNRGKFIVNPSMTFEELIASAHVDVALAYRSHVTGESFPEIYDHLADAWTLLEEYSRVNDIDLEAAVIEKQAFNETRPHRHGGKKI